MVASDRPVLDDFDLKILSLVQVDNLMPLREISERVDLSVPAVARRLRRLRNEGVIRKDICVVDETLVGRPLTIIVEVTMENERLDLIEEMKKRFAACAQVQQCFYVTGETDFILIMNVKDMTEYTALTRVLFFKQGNVKSFRTCVAMEKIKSDGAILLM